MSNPKLVELGKWADTPYPLIETPKYKARKTGSTDGSDPYVETASTMAVVHNVVLRGLNSIYLQGPNIKPADYADFIGYSLCWHSVIDDHHSSEEELFFPNIEAAVGEKGLLDGNVQQHRSFQGGLEEFKNYLEGLSGKESSFDASHLNKIISSFAPALCGHLESEIGDLLALSKYGTKLPIEDLWDKEGKHAVMAMMKSSALAFFFLNLDRTHEDSLWKNWPPVPTPARWAMIHGYTLWHQGYWKFASCDRSGVPKPLYAPGLRE